MSGSAGRNASVSSVSSISLLEIKAETRLVLQAFLHQTLSIPLTERPGRVGGEYKDTSKYSIKPQPKPKDGSGAQAEDNSSGDEKKTGLKSLIKKLPRRNTSRRLDKTQKGSLDRNSKTKPAPCKGQTDDDATSSSSSSEDEDGAKKAPKKLNRKKVIRKLSKFFRKSLEKKENDKQRNGPAFRSHGDQEAGVSSPNNPPEFYTEVAEKLEKIAKKTSSIKKQKVVPQPPPDEETVVRQLVELLSLEGDAINVKIHSDPSLCSKLSRLSYGSFAQILDIFGSYSQVSEAPPLPATDSPTLRRMAVTMEVSRRIVTATGRMQGFAERYMENFYPWIKSHGGWENVVDLEDSVEYD